ncbi:hypothetical protein MAY18_31195, partial [Escherichia coli]
MTAILVVVLLLTWIVGKVIFLRFARRLLPLLTNLTDDDLIDGVARKIASIVAVTFVLYLNQMLPSFSDEVNITFKTICWALII